MLLYISAYPYVRQFNVYVLINEEFIDIFRPPEVAKIYGIIHQCDANGEWVYENTYTDLRRDDEVFYHIVVLMTDFTQFKKRGMFVVTRGPDGNIEFCTENQALNLEYK